MVCPGLEYCVQFYLLHLKKDTAAINEVQRYIIRMTRAMKKLPYEERVKKIELPTLDRR